MEWKANNSWAKSSGISKDVFLNIQRNKMLATAFKIKESVGAINKGSIVRGTWLGEDYDNKQLRVAVLPPVGSKAPVTIVLIPFTNLDEVEGKVEFGRDNVLKPKMTVSEVVEIVKDAVVPEKSEVADVKLSDKQKIIYGVIIGLAVFGGLKVFKLI